MPVDLLFKKPFQLTRHLELMVGLGPEIVRVSGTKNNGTFAGIEFALDLLYWPTAHVGLYAEPSYGLVFRGGGNSQGLGATGGVIFGW